jgi:hypothetical protein
MLSGVEGIRACSGFHLGHSDWLEVDHAMLTVFGSLMDERLQGTDGSGEPQVPCAVVLALMVPLLQEIYVLEDTLNLTLHGIRELHFLSPVPLNSGVRIGATVKVIQPIGEQWEMILACVMECDALHAPILRADVLYRFRSPSVAVVPQLSLCRSW